MTGDGSKKYKPIIALSHSAGLKSCPISALLPLQDKENPHEAKLRGMGQVGRGKIAIEILAREWHENHSNP